MVINEFKNDDGSINYLIYPFSPKIDICFEVTPYNTIVWNMYTHVTKEQYEKMKLIMEQLYSDNDVINTVKKLIKEIDNNNQ